MQNYYLFEKFVDVTRPTLVVFVGHPAMHLPRFVSINLTAFCFHFDDSSNNEPSLFDFKSVT